MMTASDKLRELLLYIAKRSRQDRKFGRVKLHKILFRSDFASYRERRVAITGARYIRDRHGPVLEGLVEIVDGFKGDMGWETVTHKGKDQHRLVALREPDLSVFTPEEIDAVNESLDVLRRYGGGEVSRLSHDFPGWRFARNGEEIPYHTVYLGRSRKPTEDEIEYGRELAGKYANDEGTAAH